MSQSRYLRTYPIEWPVFSIKIYKKDEEGWWNYSKKKRNRAQRLLQQTIYNINEEIRDENDDDADYVESYENEAPVVDTNNKKK